MSKPDKKDINPSRTGDIAELYVTTWLWDEGYEVFRNSSCVGSVDMIATKNGVPVFVDVKSKGSDLRWGHKRTEDQKKLGVKVIEFNANTRKCRWVKHHE